jgi:probable rRNA maturation factor
MNEIGSPSLLSVDFTVTRSQIHANIDRIEHLMQFAATRLGVEGELAIWLCNDEEIADLHVRFMQVPGPTDVITFPGDDEQPGGYLGDIAVSVDTAAEQATDARHSAGREIAFLCLHGLMHLAGFDDREERERAEMLGKQKELLDEFERTYSGDWDTAG